MDSTRLAAINPEERIQKLNKTMASNMSSYQRQRNQNAFLEMLAIIGDVSDPPKDINDQSRTGYVSDEMDKDEYRFNLRQNTAI